MGVLRQNLLLRGILIQLLLLDRLLKLIVLESAAIGGYAPLSSIAIDLRLLLEFILFRILLALIIIANVVIHVGERIVA